MTACKKVLVLASGGLDSTTLLALAIEKYGSQNVEALSVSYGQKHSRELQSARAVAKHYGVTLHERSLAPIFEQSNSSLLAHSSLPISRSSYAQQREESNSPLVDSYVPFRNGLFLSTAAAMALSLGCSVVCYGAHADDWAGAAYPDCSPAFVQAMGEAISTGTGGVLSLWAPFVSCSKADIVRMGLERQVPYELTWSCYEGGAVPCGTCATCIDRQRAFEDNGANDPLTRQEA